MSTERFLGDAQGRVRALQAVSVETLARGRPDAGRRRWPAASSSSRPTWCCWRWASSGPSAASLLSQLGVKLTERGNVWRDDAWMTTEPGVFTAGDMQRGQSLIVWAIADGRNAARSVDEFLMGKTA